MAHFHNDDLEYVGDDYYDVEDFYDNPFGVADTDRDSELDSVDSDFEDNPEPTRVRADTTALEARNGKDMQGIPWERLNFSRDKYRERRLLEYKNYENLPSLSRGKLGKKCLKVEKGKLFYDFQLNTRAVESTIVHFQDGHYF